MSDCNYCGEERTKNHHCEWMKSECVRINKLLKNLGGGCSEPLYTKRQVVDEIMACGDLTLISVKGGFNIITEDESEQGSWPTTTDEVIEKLEVSDVQSKKGTV